MQSVLKGRVDRLGIRLAELNPFLPPIFPAPQEFLGFGRLRPIS
jgi:hypothetical protein